MGVLEVHPMKEFRKTLIAAAVLGAVALPAAAQDRAGAAQDDVRQTDLSRDRSRAAAGAETGAGAGIGTRSGANAGPAQADADAAAAARAEQDRINAAEIPAEKPRKRSFWDRIRGRNKDQDNYGPRAGDRDPATPSETRP